LSTFVTETRRLQSQPCLGSIHYGMNAALQSHTVQSGERYPRLPNAPIIEAVVDWRAKLALGLDFSKLKEVGQKLLSPKYQFLDELRGFQFGIQQKGGAAPQMSSSELGLQGYRFRSEDKLEIATFKHDGFSFSRLKPYTHWDDVFSEAQRVWGIYKSAAGAEEVSRIALRYINRILLPLPITDFSKYLTAPPAIPPQAPQVITSLLFRAVLLEPHSGITTNLTQVIEGHPEGGGLPFILDIDTYIMKNMNPDSPEIVSHFGALREMKNRVFFASVTDQAIEMFQK
jgi:uncharacterized protein (TIGR04255 family)